MKKRALFCLILAWPCLSSASDKIWSGESELSFVKSDGNAVSDTLLFKQSIIYDLEPWKNTLKLEASNVSSETKDATTGNQVFTRTGEKYYLTEQLDRSITELSYAFLRATYEKKRFSGFQNQSTAVLGYGRYLVKNDAVHLKLEIGAGQGSDKYDECYLIPVSKCNPDTPYGDRVSGVLGYFAEDFVWQMTKTAEIGQDVSVEDTASNRISRFHAYIKSELIANFSTKIGYMAKYTDVVPADKKRLDEEVSASLIYSF